jgi:ketosteroid isomerase-like protein
VERIALPGDGGPQEAWVLTTNFYVKTAQGWRMAAHHASPGLPHEVPNQVRMAGGEAPSTLH